MKKLGLLVMPLMAISFLASCNNGGGGGGEGEKEWYEDTAYINSLTANDVTKENPDGSIGVVNTIKVNGLDHKVRLIGVDQDIDSNGNKIHTTWEFVDLLSDENGYSLATYWNDTNDTDTANHSYINSTIRKALIGDTNDINWFRYYGEEEDKEETGKNRHYASEPNYKKSVLNMLPKSLTEKGVLKIPSKYINIWDENKKPEAGWDEQVINDKLFLLSPAEMGETGHKDEEPSTTTYSYYDGADNNKRIKKQIKGEYAARTVSIEGNDLSGEYSGSKESNAGYNSHHFEGWGGSYYLRTPYTYTFIPPGLSPNFDAYTFAWRVDENGEPKKAGGFTYCEARPIAPAFCI